ncbi:hypothetical protein PR202_ga08561 [Eleusine coracana subsp. coracana]|uniref:Uncharacterized protein n=1 Tax=Eleusine coracana subsp. coracana TaxID=191504 RepID=A0AAV5C0B4_ELECO|nr:hypothetical protein PR202_ga08561 [Eleusine coracana subsp. coracana]
MPSCRHASAEISSHDVLMQSICCDHGKAMSSELPDDAMEDAEEAATTMSFYCNQWKAVKSELPWGAVEGDVVKHNDEILQDEDKASASELLWKAMELELPWGVVEEEEEEEEEQKKEEEVTDDDYDDDEILVDADKIAEIEMRRVRRGWLHAYGKGYGSFEDDNLNS